MQLGLERKTCKFEHGGEEIHGHDRIVAHASRLGNTGSPDDGRLAHSAFVKPTFAGPQGQVASRPGPRRVLKPPLSLKKMMTVFSVSPSCSSLAVRAPTLSSTAATMEARAGLSWRMRVLPSCSGRVGVFPSKVFFAFVT